MSNEEKPQWVPLDVTDWDSPTAQCNRCRRITFDSSAPYTKDRMTQPNGNPCGGLFVVQ